MLPARIDDTISHALRGSALGLISALGVGIAAVVQPFAGRASDAAPFHDRRRPFVAAGALLTLPGMLLFGLAPTFLVLVTGYMLIQVATNIAQAGFQAFIPDLVRKRERGIASGAKNGLTVLGAAIGLIGIRLCQRFDLGTGPQLIWLALLLLIPAALTILWVPRIPPLLPTKRRGGMRRALDPRALYRSIRIAMREHKTFELAVIAQFLFFFGGYPAQRYLVYFLRDRFGAGAEEKASIGMVGAILIATLSAVVAGALSDRIGRVRILQINVVLAAAGLFIVAFAPTLPLAAAGGVVVAAGYGGFLAVNWALLSDDVPEAQAAAAFGLANLSTAGAGALSGVFGPMVDLLNATVPGGTWQTTFGLAALIILAALLPLRQIQTTTQAKD